MTRDKRSACVCVWLARNRYQIFTLKRRNMWDWPVAYRRRPPEWNDPLLNGNNPVSFSSFERPIHENSSVKVELSKLKTTELDFPGGRSHTKPPHTQATLFKDHTNLLCVHTLTHPVVNSFPSLRPRSIDWPSVGADVPDQRCNTTPEPLCPSLDPATPAKMWSLLHRRNSIQQKI